MSEIPEVFAIFEQKLAHVLSFTLREKGQKKAIEELLVYFSGIVERASKAEARIAELEAEVTKSHELQDSYCDRIAELEAERRWIPVGEKPLEAGTFFVLLKNGEVTKDWTFIDGGRYYWWNHGANITHYMPLPEPPIVYGKVCEE